MAIPATIRDDFPILKQRVHGRPLVYLDSANTSQKPRVVIDALVRYYEEYNANIHRGVYAIAERATAEYEAARAKVARFLGAAEPAEIVFTRNITEALNLVAHSWGRRHVGPGDEILTTEMEHHSDLVPWQFLAQERGARLRHIPFDDEGRLVLGDLDRLLTARTKIVSLVHVSNTFGTVNPVAEIARRAHRPAPPGRRAGPRCRRLRLHGPQDARADGGGRAVGPAGASGGDGAVSRRRRDDQRRVARPRDLERGAVEVRSRHAERGRHDRARRGRGVSGGPRHGRRGGPRAGAHRVRAGAAPRRAGPADSRAGRGRGPGRGHLVRDGRRASPRHRAGARRGRRVRAGGAPLHEAAAPAAGHRLVGPRQLLRVHDARGDRRARAVAVEGEESLSCRLTRSIARSSSIITATRATGAWWSRPTWCATALTRCAATRSGCRCGFGTASWRTCASRAKGARSARPPRP